MTREARDPMSTRLIRDDISTFRLRRAVASNLLVLPDVHPLVRPHLEELNTLLGKAVFAPAAKPVPGAKGGAGAAAPAAAMGATPLAGGPPAPSGAPAARPPKQPKKNGHAPPPDPFQSAAMRAFLARPLSGKYVPQVGGRDWEANSLADWLSNTAEAPGNYTLSDLIDKSAELSQLKYSFLDDLQDEWTGIAANARSVLQNYPNIRDYLLAYAYVIQQVREDDAVRNLIVNHKNFVRRIVGYAAISGARTHIEAQQLRVDDYNVNTSDFVTKVLGATLYVSNSAFLTGIEALIDEFVFDRDEEKIISSLDPKVVGVISPAIKPLLIKYIQSSPIAITAQNAITYIPHFLLDIQRRQSTADPLARNVALPAEDFHVRFEDTTDTSLEVSTSAVLCAAQTFHSMVLGEELDVFGAVNYLSTRRLVMGGGIRFKDPQLRRDLQDYVFDNEFEDTLTHSRMTRTRPAERQMFYRQVFNFGDASGPEDMPTNSEFEQLWKVLMIESARYLERAQASLHPDSFVSGQGVMQAVEDLQYNLSTNCTGMATVIAPITDAELNFVLSRILKHEEIVRYVVPEGGSWKNVVDTLNVERQRFARKSDGRRTPVCNAATLYNKARQGMSIIENVATYVPGDFDDLGKLSAFIGLVDGFITTNSILQRRRSLRGMPRPMPEEEEQHEQEPHAYMNDGEEAEGAPQAPEPAQARTDEWDF